MFKPDLIIDLLWLDKISYRLERFRKQGVNRNVYVCRCPYCGDSSKSTKKARLYFYVKQNQLNFDCKNCGEHGSFYSFVRDQAKDIFDEYKKEQVLKRFENKRSPVKKQIEKKRKKITKSVKNIKGVVPILSLHKSHHAYQYLLERGFTETEMARLLYAEDFKFTSESISSEPLSNKFPSDPRIVIPFYGVNGEIEMIQGRSLNKKSGLRYISIKTHEDIDKIFGKYETDFEQTVYCVEGPFDSLFIDNCLATCDSSLTKAPADVYIWDNQPRSKEIVSLMENAIEKKCKVVIWPNSPDAKMDINDMIQMGITREELKKVIEMRTFSGLKAKLELTKWRKV